MSELTLQPHRLSHGNNIKNNLFSKGRRKSIIINTCYYGYHLPSICNGIGLSSLLSIFLTATMKCKSTMPSFADVTEAERLRILLQSDN